MSSHWHHSLSVAGAPVSAYRGKCKYKSGRCTNERTLKENGEPHTLCEPHRLQHNKNQRKSDIKRRKLKKQSQMQDAMNQQLIHTDSHRISTESTYSRNSTSVVHPISFTDSKSSFYPPPSRRPQLNCTEYNDIKSLPSSTPSLYTRVTPPNTKLEAPRTIESTLLPPLYHSITYPPRYHQQQQQPLGLSLKHEPQEESKPPPAPLPDEWSHEDIVILTEIVGLPSSSRPPSASRSSASL